MRRRVFLILFLALFLLPVVNLPLSHDSPATGHESLEAPFTAAIDGSESPESLTSFSSTLENDVLFYPDAFLNDTVITTEVVSYGTQQSGDPTKIDTLDGYILMGYDAIAPYDSDYMYVNFTIPSGIWIEGIDINVYARAYDGGGSVQTMLYNWTGDSWYEFDSGQRIVWGADFAWYNYTYGTSNNSAFVGSNLIRVGFEDTAGTAGSGIRLDYIEIQLYVMHLADSNHYAESFADVSEWAEGTWSSSTPEGTFTSDGDVVSFEDNHAGGNDNDGWYTNGPSFSSTDYYYEIRHKLNDSGAIANAPRLYLFEQDDQGGAYPYLGLSKSSTWVTDSGYITGDAIGSGSAIESALLILLIRPGDDPVKWDIDYFRISPEDERGWQHDGSTTEAVSGVDDTNFDYVFSSDGDILNITTTVDTGSSYNGDSKIVYDTTATASDLEDSDYPFLEINYSCSIEGGAYYMYTRYGGKTTTTTLTTGGTWTVLRVNVAAGTSSGNADIYFRYYRNGVGATANLLIDWVKAYSIANWTVTQSGAGTDDYLYVSSSVLYSQVDSGTIEADHDPALSVASASYAVYNLTTSTTAPEFSQYVSSWSTYSANTRGATSSGTVTDIKLRFDATEDLSAIKFIEDGTAPTISDFWTVPYTPTEDDDLTLAIYETDGTGAGTYTVKFNAVDYPAGFSDVDYSATESSTKSGLWSYTFDSADVPAGYYAFEVTATDGANSATDLQILRVTTVFLQITDIVLITATEELAQISGHSNKDCSYQIYENDTLQGSGSVSSGWFSIAWTKDSTAGAYIDLGIKFYVGAYSDWINGSYSVASADVLQVTDTSVTETSTEVQLSGYASLSSNYYVYSNNTYQSVTGALTSGSFAVTFTKLTTIALHRWAIKFNDSYTTRWVNGSYDVSTVYGEATIKAYFSSGIGIEDIEDKFKIYVDGVRSSDSFYAITSGTYEICVKDFFDNEIYNASHSWAKFIDIEFDYYTVKIYSQIQDDPIYFTLTIGGSTISEYIGIGEILRYYLAAGTYTYTFIQGGQVYSGPLVLGQDYYYVVTDLDLWDLWYKPEGGGGDDDEVELYTLNILIYGILGLFGFMFLLQIPSIMNWLSGKMPQSSGDRRRRY